MIKNYCLVLAVAMTGCATDYSYQPRPNYIAAYLDDRHRWLEHKQEAIEYEDVIITQTSQDWRRVK